MVSCAKVSPKMNPRDLAGNAEEEKDHGSQEKEMGEGLGGGGGGVGGTEMCFVL